MLRSPLYCDGAGGGGRSALKCRECSGMSQRTETVISYLILNAFLSYRNCSSIFLSFKYKFNE